MKEDNHSFIDTPIELGTGKGSIIARKLLEESGLKDNCLAIVDNKKEKKTIFQVIQDRLIMVKPIEKPATDEDIKQLERELKKAKLEKEIANVKASIPKQVHPIVKVLKALAENEAKAKKKKPKFTI